MKQLLAVLLLALIPAASAQEGCLQSDPCEWILDVDDEGFDETDLDGDLTATSGDWYVVQSFNFDDVTHQITIGSFETLSVESINEASSQPFQIGLESFTIRDDVTGEELLVTVSEEDTIDSESSSASEANETPAVGLLAIVAVAVIAALRRK